MKKKTLGLIIAGVAAASMIGTGFAAWVITANAEKEVEGQFRVDTVEEKGVDITAEFAEGEGYINFLAPADATTGKWLTNTNTTNLEDLNTILTVSFDLSGAQASDFVVTYKISVDDATQAAIDAKYITAPTLTVASGTAPYDATDTTVTIAFDWGAAFGGDNPYDFYNDNFDYGDKVTVTAGVPAKDENGNTTIEAVAKAALSDLETKLKNAKFTITITAKPATAND